MAKYFCWSSKAKEPVLYQSEQDYCFLCIVLLRILRSNTILWGDLFVSLNYAWNSGRKDCYGCVAG